MGDEFELRAATNADGEAVRALVFGVLREYGLTPDPAVTDADLYDIESAYVRPGGSFDLLVDPAGAVIGTVGVVPTGGGRCKLRKMFLVSSHRGRGLGKRLLRRALERARQFGCRRVELETIGVLREAVGLYESFGFRVFVPDHLSASSTRADRAYFLELPDPDGA